jgi:ribosomal protein L15
VVNLDTLAEVFDAGSSVTPELLRERGLVRHTSAPVKVLGRGDIAKQLTVYAHKFSGSAAQKIAAAGGAAELIETARDKEERLKKEEKARRRAEDADRKAQEAERLKAQKAEKPAADDAEKAAKPKAEKAAKGDKPERSKGDKGQKAEKAERPKAQKPDRPSSSSLPGRTFWPGRQVTNDERQKEATTGHIWTVSRTSLPFPSCASGCCSPSACWQCIGWAATSRRPASTRMR